MKSFSKSSADPRQVIFLLGMHRSGTSVLSRLINLMGAYIGNDRELLPPDAKHNPAGYWERLDLVSEHERILQKNGYMWWRIAHFSMDRLDSSAIQAFCVRLAEICAHIDTGAHPLLIKDPRLCLLLPVWHRIVDEPYYVFAVRDPGKVAASMMQSFPGMFTIDYLLAFWQKHVQAALSAVKDRRVLFISYEDLLKGSSAIE